MTRWVYLACGLVLFGAAIVALRPIHGSTPAQPNVASGGGTAPADVARPTSARSATRIFAPAVASPSPAARRPAPSITDTAPDPEAAERGEAELDLHPKTAPAIALTAEDEALLEGRPLEELPHMIGEAERAYREATDAERDEADQRYLALLNLAAKAVPAEGPKPTPALIARQQEYLAALPLEQQRMADLPPADRDARLAAFKQHFFGNVADVEEAP